MPRPSPSLLRGFCILLRGVIAYKPFLLKGLPSLRPICAQDHPGYQASDAVPIRFSFGIGAHVGIVPTRREAVP